MIELKTGKRRSSLEKTAGFWKIFETMLEEKLDREKAKNTSNVSQETDNRAEPIDRTLRVFRNKMSETINAPRHAINLKYYVKILSAIEVRYKGEKINARLNDKNEVLLSLGDSPTPIIKVLADGKCIYKKSEKANKEADVRELIDTIFDILD